MAEVSELLCAVLYCQSLLLSLSSPSTSYIGTRSGVIPFQGQQASGAMG